MGDEKNPDKKNTEPIAKSLSLLGMKRTFDQFSQDKTGP
jgi:hypothetical protein